MIDDNNHFLERKTRSGSLTRYLIGVASCAAVTALTLPVREMFAPANVVMIYLLAVVLTARLCGAGPAVLAAVSSVALFDFFFVPPHLSFAVTDAQYLITFAVMLCVTLIIGQLTARLREASRLSSQRAQLTQALYEMARRLSGVAALAQAEEAVVTFLRAHLRASATVLVTDRDDRLAGVVTDSPAQDLSSVELARSTYDRGESVEFDGVLYLPLRAPMRCRGVLAVRFDDERVPQDSRREILETVASMIAIVIERIHYVDVAHEALLDIQSEQLRNSLLAALSHDLRTPLTAMVGLADSLASSRALDGSQREIAQSLREQALRLNQLVHNLLDMARLQSGRIQLRKEWQPLEEVVGSSLKNLESELRGKDVCVNLASDLPLLYFDAVLIERVLFNLLDNAAKYGRGEISIAAHRHGEVAEVSVCDEGPGLPEGETLFDKFVRGRAESERPGIGLGLAICRAIIAAHDGAIEGHNRPEGGACFRFTLPIGRPPTIDEKTLEAQAGGLP